MYQQIKRALAASLMSLICFVAFAQKTVSGTVTDATGEPMIGVTILADGKPAAVTDFDGNFAIQNVSSSTKIKISYVGYKDQEFTVGNQSQFNITLAEDAQTLNEVVVVGYGTMKKSDLTGSVSSVNTEQLNAKGAPSVLGNLQGSNPGVNITQIGGRANNGFNIEIRGKSSMNSSTTPLYVVDGVMCDDIDWLNPQDIERIDVLKDASSTAIYGSRATAGVIMVTTKGGLNVKKEQKPTINYDGYYGWSKIARMPEFQDAQQFYNYRFTKFLTAGGNQATVPVANPVYQIGGTILEQALLREKVGSGEYKLKSMLHNNETYDWPGLVTQNGSQQNHFISVNGSSETVNYHFGIGYNGEIGTYKGDEKHQFNFKGSVDARVNKVISAGFTINAARTENEYANDDAVKFAYRMNPYFIPYDKDGNTNHKPGNQVALGTTASGYQFSDQMNTLDIMKSNYTQRETWRALGNVYLKLDIMKGLDVKTTFSPNYTYWREGFFGGYKNPATGQPYDDGTYNAEPGEDNNKVNEAYNRNSRGLSWTWDNVVNYNTTIGEDHNISLMGLYSMEHHDSESLKWAMINVRELTDWWNLNSTLADTPTLDTDNSSTGYGENSMTSYAFRANYSYKGKYMVTATVRWDGCSKFDKDHRWGSFPSAAVAWRISEENFMKRINWVSNLKLRLAYGKTGNNKGAGNFDTQQTVGSVYYPFGTGYSQGYYPSTIVNKILKWETSEEYNAGLDFGFLNGRVFGSIDVYQKTSDNLLRSVDLPLETGGVSMKTNIGSVRNRGIEVALTTVNIESKDWHWETTFTFSHNQNKVRNIDGIVDRLVSSGVTTGSLFVDYSINNTYAYDWGGIVSDRNMTAPDNEATRNAGIAPGTTMKEYDYYYKVYGLTEGQPYVVDQNGDGKIDTDDRIIRSMDPKWIGSFTSNLSWKNWDFSFSLYAKQNFKVYSNFRGEYLGLGDRGRMRLHEDWYIPAGTLIDVDGVNPDGTYINPVFQTSTHYGDFPFPSNNGSNGGVGSQGSYWDIAKCITDASFVKVKNITLGYTFPKTFLSKFGCKHLRLYCTVTNPFVFTKYDGFDPEWADTALKNDGPSTINYQVGASIKF